jgi:RNA polymerase sigma-70 factor (ECF subfamily)
VNSPDDEDILSIQRVLAGDREAFSSIVSKYERRLRSYCRARLPDTEVDDTVQDILIRAFRGLGGFRLGSSFSPWLFTIAFNVIAGRKHRFRNEEEKRQRFAAEPARDLEENEGLRLLEAEALLSAVRSLPGMYRDAVEMYYYAELPVEDIAKVLGVGNEAVKTRLFRARKLLRVALEGGNREGLREVY